MVVEIVVFILFEDGIKDRVIGFGVVPDVPEIMSISYEIWDESIYITKAIIRRIEVVRLIPRISCVSFTSVKLWCL